MKLWAKFFRQSISTVQPIISSSWALSQWSTSQLMNYSKYSKKQIRLQSQHQCKILWRRISNQSQNDKEGVKILKTPISIRVLKTENMFTLNWWRLRNKSIRLVKRDKKIWSHSFSVSSKVSTTYDNSYFKHVYLTIKKRAWNDLSFTINSLFFQRMTGDFKTSFWFKFQLQQ